MALLMRPPVPVPWCKIRAHGFPTSYLIQRSTIGTCHLPTPISRFRFKNNLALIYSGGSISPPSAGGDTSVCFVPVEAPIDVTIPEARHTIRTVHPGISDSHHDWGSSSLEGSQGLDKDLRSETYSGGHRTQEGAPSLEENPEGTGGVTRTHLGNSAGCGPRGGVVVDTEGSQKANAIEPRIVTVSLIRIRRWNDMGTRSVCIKGADHKRCHCHFAASWLDNLDGLTQPVRTRYDARRPALYSLYLGPWGLEPVSVIQGHRQLYGCPLLHPNACAKPPIRWSYLRWSQTNEFGEVLARALHTSRPGVGMVMPTQWEVEWTPSHFVCLLICSSIRHMHPKYNGDLTLLVAPSSFSRSYHHYRSYMWDQGEKRASIEVYNDSVAKITGG
ncbi:hypothetical protein H4582DRAFT_2128483 [Lactarius indigo]|nr:hypothetical protein H4582DRAFT_2128483 [Lactarius indigo]